MTLPQALLLGLIEGITEFLPISSTAHLIIAQKLMGVGETSLFFNTVVQLGAILAIICYFRHELYSYIRELFHKSVPQIISSLKDRRLTGLPTLLILLLATLPVLFVGFLLKDAIDQWQESLLLIASTSAGIALLLAFAQKTSRQSITQITPKIYLILGLWQILAFLPGVSRSGIVIAGGLLWGLTLPTVLHAAFLLSIPALGAAGTYELLSLFSQPLPSSELTPTFLATLIAFISAYATIHYLLKFVRQIGLMPFVWYRIIFALFVLLLLWS